MDCQNVGSMISELYDGEPVSAEAVRHVVHCQNCRERLRDYSAIAAEMRLLAAKEREAAPTPMIPKDVLAKRSSFFFAWRKTMRVPRFVAAACALGMVLLAGAWAHTRAQNTPLWFQYKFSFDLENGTPASVGGVVQACGARCELPFTLSETDRLAGMISVEKIEDGKVYLTLRLKRFATLPDWKHLTDKMTHVPASAYVCQSGKSIQVPVTGGGEVEMTGLIVTTKEGVLDLNSFPPQPGPDQIVALKGVLIRDGQVIAELPGSGAANGGLADANAGFYAYVPGQGLFAAGLQPFDGAVPGTADYGQIRFNDNGVKYMLLTSSQITGGAQPRTIWVVHIPDFLPSRHNPQARDNVMQFGTSSAIDKILQNMGALQQK